MQIFKKPFTKKKIELIADILRNWWLLAFPTETVYWLWANALDEEACKKIFIAKWRPSDNPLIIHIAKKEDFKTYSSYLSKESKLLIDTFCPGPLTLVLKKNKAIGTIVRGWLETVAIRFPAHKLAQKIIGVCSFPLAAPSANISWRPSPTGEKDVLSDLDGKIDALVEWGDTKHWLESTVIDMTSSPPVILRHGSITKEMIKKILPNITDEANINQKKRSPWTRYKHYAPETPVEIIKAWTSKNHFWENCAFIWISIPLWKYAFSFQSKQKLAKELYKTLRHCDTLWVKKIYIEEVKEIGLWKALMNRIKKAAWVI
jgi:L-threonylcarbamoyladenylate synthase